MKLTYKKDYFGYVYIWYNKVQKKFYIGSHHGSVEDSYIGSGTYFTKAYNLNPTHFKMRVVAYNRDTDNYKDTQKLEQHYLNLIKPHKFKTRYYNLKLYATGGLGDVNSGLFWYVDPLDNSKRGFFAKGTEPKGWAPGRGISTCLGRMWYYNPNNPTERGRFEIDADIPSTWVRGSGYQANSNKKCYHNPSDTSQIGFFSKDDIVPDKWIPGNGNTHRLGKKWFISPDKTQHKLFNPKDAPLDWVLEPKNSNSNKKWFRDAKGCTKLFVPGTEPHGWLLGRKGI